MVFEKLKSCDPAAAANIGDLAAEHRSGAKRLQRVAQAVESVLSDREVLRETVHGIVRDFIEHERRHIAMEERISFRPRLGLCSLRSGRRSPQIERSEGSLSVRPSKRGSTLCEGIFSSWSRRLRRNGRVSLTLCLLQEVQRIAVETAADSAGRKNG